MRNVDLKELQHLLRQMPLMAQIRPLSLAFIPEEVRVFEDPWQMAAELDTPIPQPTKGMLATRIEPELQHRLPAVQCIHDPFTTELNRVLLNRYELIKANMLSQSQVADQIASEAGGDCVLLMLVDGLGYSDMKQHASRGLGNLTPVLVDGVSNTEQGMFRLIGKPSLAQRLFDLGFRTCLGFTYWERAEEPLTNCLFEGFGDRVSKVKSFAEVLAALEGEDLSGAFVQIVREGLDGAGHRQREKPNVESLLSDILEDFERLVHLCERKKLAALLHVVSDHGILWAHEHDLRPYEFGEAGHPRYYEHAKYGEQLLALEFGGREYSLLNYPYLRRNLRSTEWGVHGGLSFEESIVPWLSVKTGMPANG